MTTRRSVLCKIALAIVSLVGIATTAKAASPPDVEFLIPPDVPVQSARDVASDAAGNLYIVMQGTSTFDNLNYLTKTNPAGEVLWSIGSRGDGPGEFNNPQAVAVGTGGRVYVVERGTNRVQYFRTSDGSLLGSFGSRCFVGSSQTAGCIDPDGAGPLELGDGQFFQPTDIAADTAGNIYIADFNNHRIQVFSATGTFIRKIRFDLRPGSRRSDQSPGMRRSRRCRAPALSETASSTFQQGVAVAGDGRIAVADSETIARVQIFDNLGNLLLKIGANGGDGSEGSGEGDLSDGRRTFSSMLPATSSWATGTSLNRINVFNPSGAFLTRFVGGCNEPSFPCDPGDVDSLRGLGLDGRRAAPDRRWRHRANLKVYTVGGGFVGEVGNYGPAPLLEGAQSVDFDNFGNFYVGGSRKIRVYRPDGSYAREISPSSGIIGITGIAAEIVPGPLGIPTVRLVVSNVFRSTVDILDANGAVIGRVGFGNRCIARTGDGCTDPDGSGPLELGDGQFVNQSKVSIGYDRRIYVADNSNHRIQVFDRQWQTSCSSLGANGGDGNLGNGDGEFFNPKGVAAGPDGRIYVADTRNSRVQVFDASGNFLFAFGEQGDGPGQFDQVDRRCC